MAEDTEYIKLPLMQRVTHKQWKARVHGYNEAAQLFQAEDDEKSAMFSQYTPLVAKFVGDTNAAAQEKGIEATLYFVQKSSLGGKTAKEVMPIIVGKSISASRKGTQEFSLQLVLMYIEIEKQEIVIEELIKGFEQKNPKVVAACVSTISTALKAFGSQVIGIKPLVKPLIGLLEDRDKTVRDEAKALVIEIYRWIGEAIMPQLAKLKPIQLTELQGEFAKVRGEKAVPTRWLRSQQEKQAKVAAEAVEDAGEDGVAVVDAPEIDPLSLIDPINVLSKIPNDFYERLEAKKWQDRKAAIDDLDKILDYPKFEKGEYGDLVRALMKIITKDANVVVVGVTVKCMARLASGLKKGFSPYAVSSLSNLLAKFKEKKANVVTPLREAVDAIFPCTNLEAIQEDVFAALDNKNPSIKAETAAFLARCLAQVTPDVLNKKILKAYATALLKTLNEPDPTVRDSSAEALGVAMKVVGEKAITPFLPDIDPLKLAKIKEFCEKAVVKAAPVKAAPAKAAPAAAKAEPKKVLSGGAIRQQAPKVVRPPVVETEKEMSSEEVDEKAAEYLEEGILKSIEDSAWKTRLEGIESYQNILMSMEPSEVAAEVMTKVLTKKPGLKDNNFQVMKLKLDCLKYIAETFPISAVVVRSVIPDVTEKLGDPKNGTYASEALMALAEVTNLDNVGTIVFEFAFSQKSVKIQQEALDWMSEAIQNFGFVIDSKTVIENLKKGLSSTNAAVKQSSAGLAGVASMYLGQQLLMQRLDVKPAVMTLVSSEIEKRTDEEPPEPNRTCKIARPAEKFDKPASPAPVRKQPPQQSQPIDDSEDSPVENKEKPAARIDIGPKITEQILADLGNKDWKVRNEALTTLKTIVTDAKSIKSNLGELPGILVQRFIDSNNKLSVTALELCTALATAMGPLSKNHVRNFSRGIFNALGDNKQWVRAAALTCLNTWVAEAGAKEFFAGEVIPESLKTGSIPLKIEVWTWLSEVLPESKGIPKEELCLLIPYLFVALEDRNADVRKAANAAVLGMMTHVGFGNMSKEADRLKPASKTGIMQILDKVRPDVPEPPSTPRGKQDAKQKAPGAMPGSAAKTVVKSRVAKSLAPGKAPPRKKDVEIDTSPLLMVNKMKQQRILDENKLKILKWNFATPRSEFVDLLRDQMTTAGFNKNLMANMFHADFKFHLKAIESLSDDLGNEDALIANLDLILKWLTLRFFDTNPSVLLKGLEYLQSAFNMLIDREYSMFDTEVNSFIPYLVLKIGDPKDTVRDRVHAIVKQFSLMHTPGKLFSLIMDGLKSKNSRQRTECLDELGYLIEQFGTSVCQPSLPVALKEISKQIADRDNSVRSAALNAIVKAYFCDGEKIYKLIGHLSEKDMSYLEERIKRASQNRTKVQREEPRPAARDTTIMQKPEPEPVEEEDIYEEPEEEMAQPEPYIPEITKPVIPTYQPMEEAKPRFQKLDLIDIDYSILDSPIHIPESIRMKMTAQPPSNPQLEQLLRELASPNLETAADAGRKLHGVIKGENSELVGPYASIILDSLIVLLKNINALSATTPQPTMEEAYKHVFLILNDIFEKKTAIAKRANENQLKGIIQQLLHAFAYDKSLENSTTGINGYIALFIGRIIENSDVTNLTCAIINALYDLVGDPPSIPSLTDITTKCLLKVIVIHVKKAENIDEVFNLDRILYACHVFLQAYPRHTWKDRPSNLPLKAINTFLTHLVTKKGSDILTHTRGIENPISSELFRYLKKHIKAAQGGAVKTPAKLTKAMSDHLSEIIMKMAHESTAQEAMVEFYEFRKKHPDVDFATIMAPTSQLFQDYVAEGLRQIEKERGPLQKTSEFASTNVEETQPHPYKMPTDHKQLPQYYLDVLRWYQERLGVPVSTVPDFEEK